MLKCMAGRANDRREGMGIQRAARRTGWTLARKCLTVGALLAVLTSGCGVQTEGTTPEAVYEAVRTAVELPDLVELPDSFIADYYGINLELLDSYVFCVAEDPISVESVIVMKAKRKEDIDSLSDALTRFIKQKMAEVQNYQVQEEYGIIEESAVKSKGVYVYLVISEQVEEIEKAIYTALE